MKKQMTKSEVRCATLINNLLTENMHADTVLEKIKNSEQHVIRPGVGKIDFATYVIDFVHSKTAEFVNLPDKPEPIINNVFNVPEIEPPTVKPIAPSTSTSKKGLDNRGKKTVSIHKLDSKIDDGPKLTSTIINEQRSLDILASLYAEVINSNMLCNLFHELGYAFTLLSIKDLKIKSNNESFNSNNVNFKSPKDCHYFASKTLQHLLPVLMYLEKPIINLISKHKIINTYVPELARTLECEIKPTKVTNDNKYVVSSLIDDKVKFDEEQDTKDCFPTFKMFYGFKSQRDAFYDLLEDWKQNQFQLNFKKLAIIQKMLNEHTGVINMTKFTKLFVGLLLNSSFEDSKNVYKNIAIQGLSATKLELLHQRITKRDYSSGNSIDPANEFPGVQGFFREFIILSFKTEHFCKHLIDTLVHRIDVLNAMEWASELEGDIYQQTYFFYFDTLKLLSKFLGFTIYHPYKDYNMLNPSLKEYLLEVRSKVQPPLNLLDKLHLAIKQGHSAIVLTMSWLIEYMYQVDLITIATPFYKNILTWLYSICMINSLTTSSVLLLKLQFNCLIESINIAPDILFDNYTKHIDRSLIENAFKDIKNYPLVNTKQMYYYCPQLNNYRIILQCKVNNKKLKFISPIPSSPMRKGKLNKLVESELESNFFENHSLSVMVTIDFVAKRIASSCTKKIQTEGIASVKNHFVDIVCMKFKEYVSNPIGQEFQIDENDVAKCSFFMSSTIQQYIDHFSKTNIPSSIKELLDFNTVKPDSLPFCIAVTIRKFKELVAEWVKNHINIKNIFITFIATELKQNLKCGEINEDCSNLHKLLMATQNQDEPDEHDMFVPDNKLLMDLNMFSLKMMEVNDYKLTSDDLFEYSEQFKIILDNKNKIHYPLYKFIIVRLVDNILLTTFHTPKLINTNVMKAYHPYLNEMLYKVSMIISERNIYILSEKCNSEKVIMREKITSWIQYFIENNFLTIDELTNQIMSILRLSWPEDTLKCLSLCFKDLNDICVKKFDDSKVQELFMWLTHFMEVIEDYDVEF